VLLYPFAHSLFVALWIRIRANHLPTLRVYLKS
jgi:hypothetical protein